MIGGYLLFEIILYGFGAVASVPGNAVQAIASIIISSNKRKCTRRIKFYKRNYSKEWKKGIS